MSAFPFGHGAATSVYLILYLATWVVHFFLVSAVLGGSVTTGVAALRGRKAPVDFGSALPLFLGLAITAGVAPLLFVQLLYQDAFYTAHLLLHVRFLAVVPALMTCFYLLYFAKTERAQSFGPRWQAAIWFAAAGLAVFIGVSWVELHTLALDPETWVETYAEGASIGGDVALRAAAFFAGTVAMTATVAMVLEHSTGKGNAAKMAPIGCIGAVLTLALGALYGRSLPEDVTTALTSGSAGVHLALAAGLGIVLAVLFAVIAAAGEVRPRARAVVYAVSGLWLWSIAVCREVIRAIRLDLPALSASHEASNATGGQIAFVVFGLANAIAIGWCCKIIWRIWRDDRARRESP